jgi:hypothetical protein
MKVLSASCVNSVEIRRYFIPSHDMVGNASPRRSLLRGYLTTATS